MSKLFSRLITLVACAFLSFVCLKGSGDFTYFTYLVATACNIFVVEYIGGNWKK